MRHKKLFEMVLALATVTSGAALAAPVSYTIQPGHTYPSFETPHMGISWWRGKFNHSEGKVTLDPQAKTGTVDITIDIASVDFGHDRMNEVAKDASFFNVAKFPTAHYVGKIVYEGDTPARVDGQLTLLGVTKSVPLKILSFKCIKSRLPNGGDVCGADAEGQFDRAVDFGMTRDSDDGDGAVKLRIQVEARRD